MTLFYILEGTEYRPALNYEEWAKWMESHNRTVARSTIEDGDNPIIVSTVFLGIDHGWGLGHVILFETMVFCNEEKYPDLQYHMKRSKSFQEAEQTHEEICTFVRASIGKHIIE